MNTAGIQEAIPKETQQIAEEAFVYGFPTVMNYGVFYDYFIDKASPNYKAPFNQINNVARVFTPQDTAVVTPNSDTPYSFVGMDLRAERHRHVATRRALADCKGGYGSSCGRDDLPPGAHRRGAEHAV
jgi:hypothetical protein